MATSAFASARLGTFGNAGRNILRGPGTFNVDFSAHKVFTIRERLRLQYRAEFFNVFNHTLLNNPDTSFTDSTFGRITRVVGDVQRLVTLNARIDF